MFKQSFLANGLEAKAQGAYQVADGGVQGPRRLGLEEPEQAEGEHERQDHLRVTETRSE